MKTVIYLFIVLPLLFTVQGCDDIIEEDISDITIQLSSPANNLETTQLTHLFSWEELEGATNYRLRIVSPTFDSIVNLITDIDTEVTLQEISLTPGDYQWTVIGENFSYETESNQIYNLKITGDSSLNLINSPVLLIFPENNTITNQIETNFSWQALFNADGYTFQIASPDFSNLSNIIVNKLTTATSEINTLSSGMHAWRVRAENSQNTGPWTERSFEIDLNAPNAPQLQVPINNASVSLPIFLDWTPDSDSVFDSLYVYADSLATPPVLQVATTNNEYLFNDNLSNEYFWRVRTFNSAGTGGAFSELRQFIVQ